MKNTDVVAHKLELVLRRVTNHGLKVAREKRQKSEEIIKRWETKAMAIKCQRARREISLSSGKKENYENDIRNKTDPD